MKSMKAQGSVYGLIRWLPIQLLTRPNLLSFSMVAVSCVLKLYPTYYISKGNEEDNYISKNQKNTV